MNSLPAKTALKIIKKHPKVIFRPINNKIVIDIPATKKVAKQFKQELIRLINKFSST